MPSISQVCRSQFSSTEQGWVWFTTIKWILWHRHQQIFWWKFWFDETFWPVLASPCVAITASHSVSLNLDKLTKGLRCSGLPFPSTKSRMLVVSNNNLEKSWASVLIQGIREICTETGPRAVLPQRACCELCLRELAVSYAPNLSKRQLQSSVSRRVTWKDNFWTLWRESHRDTSW